MGLRNREDFKNKRYFFVTTTCNRWQHIFTNDTRCRIITNSLNFVANKYDARFLAYVLIRKAAPPNHLHFIIVFDGENLLGSLMRDFNRTGDPEIYFW
jgi:REP element-mobilizing transposase RayT